MARPKKPGNMDLPPNLRYDKTNKIFKYRHPQTKKSSNLPANTSKQDAIEAARLLNDKLSGAQNLVSKILGTKITLAQFIDNRFLKVLLPARELAASTKKDYERKCEHIKKSPLGNRCIDVITVLDIAEFLNPIATKNSNRYRSLLIVIFQYTTAEGLSSENVPEKTLKKNEKKERGRITKEEFKTIYDHPGTSQLLKNAMDLALYTLQREWDLVNIKFPEEGQKSLKIIPKKTKKHGIIIGITIGPRLKKIIKRCRDNIPSPYLLHRMPEKRIRTAWRTHYTQISADFLSRLFAETRDKIGLYNHLPPRKRPSFHELRSRGIAHYKEMGVDPKIIKNLAGHSTDQMMDHYLEGHFEEIMEAKTL